MLALRIWPYGLTQSYKTSLYVEDCSSLIRTLVSLVDVGCQHSDTPPPHPQHTHPQSWTSKAWTNLDDPRIDI